jgi:hypothetical protein
MAVFVGIGTFVGVGGIGVGDGTAVFVGGIGVEDGTAVPVGKDVTVAEAIGVAVGFGGGGLVGAGVKVEVNETAVAAAVTVGPKGVLVCVIVGREVAVTVGLPVGWTDGVLAAFRVGRGVNVNVAG